MSKKLFIAMRALPWDMLNVGIGKTPDGKLHTVKAAGDEKNAGFLPVFWSREAAEEAYPDATIQEGEVADHWGEADVPQDKQGDGVVNLDREGLLNLIQTTELTLAEDQITKARELTLGGKKPSARFGEGRLRNYYTALSISSEA